MKQFEYKIITIGNDKNSEKLTTEMNEMGKEGWELVSASEFSNAGWTQVFFEASITSGFLLFFKREKLN